MAVANQDFAATWWMNDHFGFNSTNNEPAVVFLEMQTSLAAESREALLLISLPYLGRKHQMTSSRVALGGAIVAFRSAESSANATCFICDKVDTF